MQVRRLVLFIAVICVASGWLSWKQSVSVSAAQAPQQPAADTSPGVIRVETRLVLVDSVVTDKKGNYVRDLTAKEFKVWEDNKEQAITTFSFEGIPPRRRKTRNATWCCSSITRPWIWAIR